MSSKNFDNVPLNHRLQLGNGNDKNFQGGVFSKIFRPEGVYQKYPLFPLPGYNKRI